MTKVLVLYYSMYGHVETMAKAIAEGAEQDGRNESSPNISTRRKTLRVLRANRELFQEFRCY